MALKLFLPIVLLNLLLVLIACAAPATEIKIVPEFIIEKGNQFIISKVGAEYFNKYITFSPSDSRYVEGIDSPVNAYSYLNHPYYFMVYSFIIPDKPFVDEGIWFSIDLDGNVVGEPPGIPDLIKDPREGDFPIDEQMAIDIAKNAGLEEGIKDWKTSFHWYYGDLQTYVWTVQNTLRSSSGGESGIVIVIDANDGEILQQNEWYLIP